MPQQCQNKNGCKIYDTPPKARKPTGIQEKALRLLPKGFSMAAGEGFEPSHTESESAVLPLHNPAVFLTNKNYYTHLCGFVNSFLARKRNYFSRRGLSARAVLTSADPRPAGTCPWASTAEQRPPG